VIQILTRDYDTLATCGSLRWNVLGWPPSNILNVIGMGPAGDLETCLTQKGIQLQWLPSSGVL